MFRIFAQFLLAVTVSASAQAATVFSFSFSDDASDPMFGRTHVPGTVTGLMFGLSENGSGQLPTSIEFTSSVAFLGMTDSTVDAGNSLQFFAQSGFDIVNGVIIGGGFALNFNDPTVGSLQFRLNGEPSFPGDDKYNILHWNGGSGPIVGTGNRDGFSGATYALVGGNQIPEPASIALVALALAAAAVARRRRPA